MDEERKNYVEELAVYWGGFGMPKMQGRVLGALLVADPPMVTAEELAGELAASRGSISSATRSLIQMGIVERKTKPGERRDYFQTRTNWAELMHQQIGAYAAFRKIAERGLEIMDGSSPESKLDLEEIRSIYSHLEREMPGLIERWEKSREEER
ncbi:MAG: GbsR/MarR family transcriptional regulator [Rubrobacteraceae bacterium]|jgi:DNA-binding transcriptional regulator GbsR (MarR family)|nr:MarR family transcriptional regulator [Rubrobacter sp.]